jgi:hypothetical protein
MESVPFHFDLGTSTVHGILRLEKQGICIEWRIYNAVDVPKGELKTISIPYNQITNVEYRRGLVGGKITVTAERAGLFRDFPLPAGTQQELKVAIKRIHKSDAQGWSAEAALRAAESERPELTSES